MHTCIYIYTLQGMHVILPYHRLQRLVLCTWDWIQGNRLMLQDTCLNNGHKQYMECAQRPQGCTK